MSIKDSIYIIVGQVLDSFYKNVSHPINWLYAHTEVMVEIHSDSKMVAENCRQARIWIKDYIQQRKQGKRESSLSGGTDILSLMLGRPDVFSDDFVVDELLGFFGAATETTHNVFQTILTHLCMNKDSITKIRSEFSKVYSE